MSDKRNSAGEFNPDLLLKGLDNLKSTLLLMPLHLGAMAGEFEKAVSEEASRAKRKGEPLNFDAIEAAREGERKYKREVVEDLAAAIDLASERGLDLQHCRQLIESLEGVGSREPGEFLFGARVEIRRLAESIVQPKRDNHKPFEDHHDTKQAEGCCRRQIATSWFDQLTPRARNELTQAYGSKASAISKLMKDVDNLRAKRKRQG
jgi:DNA-binding transcriptional MerR regulator